MLKQKSQSLSDKIAGVLNAAPHSFNPDEEDVTPKLVEVDGFDDHDEEVPSTVKKRNLDFLSDVDSRYAGKRASRGRKNEFDVESVSSMDGEDSKDEIYSNEDQQSSHDGEQSSDDDDDDDDEEESDENKTDDDSEVAEDSGEYESGEELAPEDHNFVHVKNNVSSELKKGECVRNQVNMWENLLELRIQLQKCLLTANKMPQLDHYKAIKITSDEYATKTTDLKTTLSKTIEKMLQLKTLCVRKYPESKNVLSGNAKENQDESDEEIPSDTEDEIEEDEDFDEPPKKRSKNLHDEIAENYAKYKPYADGVIQKWNEKTRVAMGKNTTGHSVLNQIEHALSDRVKLLKRTQLKKSEFNILGNTTEPNENGEDYNAEIFDDTDFYHQLLRELIEIKSSDVTDPVQLGRQWVQLQNLRSKMKRKIDTKATKGRKIRYTVHTKLVNFMAPIADYGWTDDAKTELFGSLFGKNQSIKTN